MDGLRISKESLDGRTYLARGHPDKCLDYEWSCVIIINGPEATIKGMCGNFSHRYLSKLLELAEELGVSLVTFERIVNGELVLKRIEL